MMRNVPPVIVPGVAITPQYVVARHCPPLAPQILAGLATLVASIADDAPQGAV